MLLTALACLYLALLAGSNPKTLVLNGTHRRIHLPGATREALLNFTRFHFAD